MFCLSILQGGMAVNKSIVMHLLGRIKEFNEWGQCAVLEVVCKYKPNDEATVFRIMVRPLYLLIVSFRKCVFENAIFSIVLR